MALKSTRFILKNKRQEQVLSFVFGEGEWIRS
jgi:hypothetical protein